ncbi:MAG: hypothetical protein ACR2QU_03085 [Gammaproteobacteria bacterium]
MSDFEYLSVLVAIIVGIGFTHLILSVGRILGESKELNVSSVQLIWTANILMMMACFWWWAISLRELEEWLFLQLLFLLFDVSLWCLLAAILYPVSIQSGYDLSAHFERKSRSFFTILIILAFADPLAATILGTQHLIDLGWGYLHWIVTCFVVGVLGIRFRDKRFQQFIAIYWGFSLITFVLSWQYSVAS